MIHQVATLTTALKEAADKLMIVERTFIGAGERLQQVVDDLNNKVNTESMDNNLNEIKDLIRKGFHLSEPEYDANHETNKHKANKKTDQLSTPINPEDLPTPPLDVK